MPIDVGTLAPVSWTRPAGHTVTLTVTKPDGTELAPAAFAPATVTWPNGSFATLTRTGDVVTVAVDPNGVTVLSGTIMPFPAEHFRPAGEGFIYNQILDNYMFTVQDEPDSPPAQNGLAWASFGGVAPFLPGTCKWIADPIVPGAWPIVVTDDNGTYRSQLDCDQPGRYVLHWTDTTDDVAYVDTLEVWPADPRFLISLEDAAAAMQWRPADIAKNGDTLRLYVAAATEVIEDITGALLVRTVVQPSDGGRTGVALWERPREIVSVAVDGIATTDYIPNLNAAIVYAKPAGSRFAGGLQNVVVTYRVGSSEISPSIQLGARELVRHLWQIGQQAMTDSAQQPAYGDNSNLVVTRTGFAVPRRVIELCSNHHSLPGTA